MIRSYCVKVVGLAESTPGFAELVHCAFVGVPLYGMLGLVEYMELLFLNISKYVVPAVPRPVTENRGKLPLLTLKVMGARIVITFVVDSGVTSSENAT